MIYQREVSRTLSHHFKVNGIVHPLVCSSNPDHPTPEMLHGAIGIVTEAGELLDAMKKSIYYCKALDRTNLIEELGDLEYYMAVLRIELGVSQEEIQERNIAKLRARYPEKFTSEHAINRDLDKEREVLEQ